MLKELAEVSQIIKTEIISNAFHAGGKIQGLPFCLQDNLLLYMMTYCVACYFFYRSIQIIRSYIKVAGVVADHFFCTKIFLSRFMNLFTISISLVCKRRG